MKIYKLKELKNLVALNGAIDLTNKSAKEMYALMKEHDIDKIGISHGIYGMNGGLLRDEDGNLYAITKRSTSLFVAF